MAPLTLRRPSPRARRCVSRMIRARRRSVSAAESSGGKGLEKGALEALVNTGFFNGGRASYKDDYN